MIFTIIIHSTFIGFAASFTDKYNQWLKQEPHSLKTMLSITVVILWMLTSITICTWIWVGTYIFLDVFNSVEPAVYFSLVTMTTLGFGDITLNSEWRVLSGMTAVNGLLLFGLTTAYLVEFIFQIKKAQN